MVTEVLITTDPTQLCIVCNIIEVGYDVEARPSFSWHHFENSCIHEITTIVSVCTLKESDFPCINLSQEFTSPLG